MCGIDMLICSVSLRSEVGAAAANFAELYELQRRREAFAHPKQVSLGESVWFLLVEPASLFRFAPTDWPRCHAACCDTWFLPVTTLSLLHLHLSHCPHSFTLL